MEVEIFSTFQTHSNIYTVHAVNIVEQYIGAAENSKYATKQNSEKVRLRREGRNILEGLLLLLRYQQSSKTCFQVP